MFYLAPKDFSILETLVYLFPESSKNTLRSWIKQGRIQVEEAVVSNTSFQVYKGQKITLNQRKRVIYSHSSVPISILYEDRDLVVLDKPSGLLTVASAFEKEETLHALLKAHYRPRSIFVVHRLDQETSGTIVFAFNETTHEKLKDLFEMHAIERMYTAIVEGKMASSSGIWHSYQYEDRQYVVHDTSDPTRGRLAITHYETLAQFKRYSWLKLRLETGRKNQIRVHCRSAGHPVVGDKKYGAKTNPLHRVCLHAHLLTFQHPMTKKPLRFESAVPPEFYQVIPEGEMLQEEGLQKSTKPV
jgi:23S rRNA pseudouridine1911/1915/1917 synthase